MLHINKMLLSVAVYLLFGVMSAVAQDTGVSWYELGEAQALAKENGKKVLVFAEASWCHICKR